jgi:sucrose-6-phosphate hydrolase SacC (GH32 family)
VLTSLTGRPSGLLSWAADGGGLTLGWDGHGRPSLEVEDTGRAVVLRGAAPLVAGCLTHLAAYTADGALVLAVDGVEVDRAAWSGGLPPPLDDVVVGSRHDSVMLGGFHVEAAAGVLRSASLAAQGAVPDSAPEDRGRVDVVGWLASLAGPDPHRPAYHVMPPHHWMNEPHAPIQVDGVHHLFFQANRRGPFWGGIEWGHAVSRDLVHWTHQPPALVPAPDGVAPTGVWSGSAVRDDDGGILLYVTAGDASLAPDQSVAVARPTAGGWALDLAPTICMPADDSLVPGQFRDPFVWREGDAWFLLVGAGLRGIGGTALLYRSDDGDSWRPVGPLHTTDRSRHPGAGEMWELPVLLPIRSAAGEERHVLLVCPWWEKVPPEQVVEVLHWVGSWDTALGVFSPDHVEPRRFDFGRHFTGPSGYVSEDGRTLLWSIAQDGRTDDEHLEAGWAHNAGLPLELGLGADGRLEIAPVRELASLRDELVLDVGAATLEDALTRLPPLVARLEIEAEVTLGAAGLASLHLHADDATWAVLELTADRFRLHRPGAAAYDAWHGAELDDAPAPGPGSHLLRTFLDGSMLESYLDRSTSFTSRIRPPAGLTRLAVTTYGDARVDRLRIWRLAAGDTDCDTDCDTDGGSR